MILCAPEKLADVPGDAFFAEGIGGQFIVVLPAQQIVMVRQTTLDTSPNSKNIVIQSVDAYVRGLIQRAVAAVPN